MVVLEKWLEWALFGKKTCNDGFGNSYPVDLLPSNHNHFLQDTVEKLGPCLHLHFHFHFSITCGSKSKYGMVAGFIKSVKKKMDSKLYPKIQWSNGDSAQRISYMEDTLQLEEYISLHSLYNLSRLILASIQNLAAFYFFG